MNYTFGFHISITLNRYSHDLGFSGCFVENNKIAHFVDGGGQYRKTKQIGGANAWLETMARAKESLLERKRIWGFFRKKIKKVFRRRNKKKKSVKKIVRKKIKKIRNYGKDTRDRIELQYLKGNPNTITDRVIARYRSTLRKSWGLMAVPVRWITEAALMCLFESDDIDLDQVGANGRNLDCSNLQVSRQIPWTIHKSLRKTNNSTKFTRYLTFPTISWSDKTSGHAFSGILEYNPVLVEYRAILIDVNIL